MADLVLRRGLILGLGRHRAVADRSGLTGEWAARLLLDAHGLDTVRIEPVPGKHGDRARGRAARDPRGPAHRGPTYIAGLAQQVGVFVAILILAATLC